VNMTRRNFFIGGAAFASLGAFAGNRFMLAAAGFKAGDRPRLKFGVLSDIHVLRVGAGEAMFSWGNNLTFKHALEWFRSQDVDAVVIAGDMADKGMDENLLAVADAWYSVFPDDKYPDGRSVEMVFVTGNHDWSGYAYGGAAEKKYPDEVERAKHILQKDMAGWWKNAFCEPYAPIYSKKIKGYTFIGTHWDMGGADAESGKKVYAYGRIRDYMEQMKNMIDPALPFFYVQHPHLKDTCYGSWAWGHDNGVVTNTLSSYSNAIAFSGHSHYSLTDERSIWQGAFTSVGTGSLSYTIISNHERSPQGFENTGASDWVADARKLMKKMHTGDCRQGMIWSVYDDCITVKRREFLSDLELGDDWVLPLPAAESRPFAFAEHAKRLRAPEFPEEAKLAVTAVNVKNRGGKSKDGKEVIPAETVSGCKVMAPPVLADDKARLFSLEFTAETLDGKKRTRHVIAEGFNHSLAHKKAKSRQVCYFRKDDLGKGSVRFTVTPLNCFGARGKPLTTTFKV
ncbi:MAG: metallophosphoesterase, partial [Kiritimatiellae bacterium]|nr:metallophosphoesterase [Kiritimatiellia bacterium]